MTIYLDNAATSWPKPVAVVEAVSRWYRELGVDAVRGCSARHEEVATALAELRLALARLCGVRPSGVVLTPGATFAANLFLRGFLRSGQRVLATPLEHNALARPLVALRDEGRIELEVCAGARDGLVDAELLGERLAQGPGCDLFVVDHASNVTGALHDAAALVRVAHDAGVRVLLDCAQTAGRVALDGVGADAYVLPAHKGLMGPPGAGALCLREDLGVAPLVFGGTGSGVASDTMPGELPARLEAGTPNTPGYLGWLAGLAFVAAQRPATLLERELALVDLLRHELAGAIDRGLLREVGAGARPRVAILSFVPTELDPVEASMALADSDILLRAGYHCAPWVHALLGSEAAGTLRASPGPFNDEDEIRRAAAAISEVCGA